jgi:hypothetical protein
MTDDEIIDGYVKHVNRIPYFPPPASPADLEAALAAMRGAAEDDEYFWAWKAVDELVDSDPERAWRILLVALSRCSPNHEHFIGAGPLEELLIKQPRRFAERVAKELLANTRFQAAFTVIRFSTEYASDEDARYFNETLRSRDVNAEWIPVWRE